MSTTSERPGSQAGPRAPQPRPAAKRGAAEIEDDVLRTRRELAETVSEVVTRANELPSRAGKAMRRGMVHPATLAVVALIVFTLIAMWRARHR
jgi:hypothetical protein